MSADRSCALSPPDMLMLQRFGELIKDGFGCYPYLVGSVVKNPTSTAYRDIDIRLIFIEDDRVPDRNERKVLNAALSALAERMTGLRPIDFQIQSMAEANDDPANKGPRHALFTTWDDMTTTIYDEEEDTVIEFGTDGNPYPA